MERPPKLSLRPPAGPVSSSLLQPSLSCGISKESLALFPQEGFRK